jgi:hypothetical protein
MMSTALDLLGMALLAAFAYFLWPPAALLVLGVACLLISWRRSSTSEEPAS